MITKTYIRSVPLSSTIASSAREIFDLLLNRQASIANIDYNRRNKPHLADSLPPTLAKISPSEDMVEIMIDYPLTIRFLDMKKMKYRKAKRYYTPIYNRELYGHIYGSGYSLTNLVNSALRKQYENYYQSLKNVSHIICYDE